MNSLEMLLCFINCTVILHVTDGYCALQKPQQALMCATESFHCPFSYCDLLCFVPVALHGCLPSSPLVLHHLLSLSLILSGRVAFIYFLSSQTPSNLFFAIF